MPSKTNIAPAMIPRYYNVAARDGNRQRDDGVTIARHDHERTRKLTALTASGYNALSEDAARLLAWSFHHSFQHQRGLGAAGETGPPPFLRVFARLRRIITMYARARLVVYLLAGRGAQCAASGAVR
jgi:hypothetical protein